MYPPKKRSSILSLIHPRSFVVIPYCQTTGTCEFYTVCQYRHLTDDLLWASLRVNLWNSQVVPSDLKSAFDGHVPGARPPNCVSEELTGTGQVLVWTVRPS